ncbi:hypothetical protein Slin14017_G000450 [Septoria linicola]|nr:hypothetical protein Slin14017_G000450 [Septoria linicola]
MSKASPLLSTFIEAPVDAVLLGAWLFFEYRPWGDGHRWLNDLTIPDTTASTLVEVLEIQGRVYKHVLDAVSSATAIQDLYLPEAIAMLMAFQSMCNGWHAAVTHTQGYVRLAYEQMSRMGNAQGWVNRELPVDAFHMVLSREVSQREVANCLDIILGLLKIFRQAAKDIIYAPIQDAGQPVWRRVCQLTWHDWTAHDGQLLLPIAEKASSVPKHSRRIARRD